MKKNNSSGVIMVLISVYLIFPLALTFLYSIFEEWTGILPRGITFSYYIKLFSDTSFILSVFRTITASVLPVLISAAVILLVMYAVVVYMPGLDKYVQILCTIPYAIQGIILAVGILSMYSDAPGIFSNRMIMLICTYCVIILPYMYQGIRNNLAAVNAKQLIETAQMLGCCRLPAFFRIIVPNILPGITVSAMLSMSIIFGDFTVVNILGGNYYETAQIYLSNIMRKSGHMSSAVIMILFIVTMLISTAVFSAKNKYTKEER